MYLQIYLFRNTKRPSDQQSELKKKKSRNKKKNKSIFRILSIQIRRHNIYKPSYAMLCHRRYRLTSYAICIASYTLCLFMVLAFSGMSGGAATAKHRPRRCCRWSEESAIRIIIIERRISRRGKKCFIAISFYLFLLILFSLNSFFPSLSLCIAIYTAKCYIVAVFANSLYGCMYRSRGPGQSRI